MISKTKYTKLQNITSFANRKQKDEYSKDIINHLKKRLIIVIMSLLIAVLAIIFIILIVVTSQNLNKTSSRILDNNVTEYIEKNNMHNKMHNKNDSLSGRYGNGFVVLMSDNGDILDFDDNLDNENMDINFFKLIIDAYDSDKVLGTTKIDDYVYKYKKYKAQNNVLISFVDYSSYKEIFKNQVYLYFSIISLATFGFYFVSKYLAGIAIKPIEANYIKQKSFIQDASHELRTPLTVIMSNISLLKKSDQSKDHTDYFNVIEKEAFRMKKLIEDLLFLSTSEKNEVNESFEDVNFSEVILESCMLFESVFFECGKVLDYEVSEDIFIYGNHNHLKQLINIFLDNSKKYASYDSTIYVRLYNDKNKVILNLSNKTDNLTEKDLGNMFERFYKKDEARTRSNQSYGLGLTIAQNIIKNHDGYITTTLDKDEITFKIIF